MADPHGDIHALINDVHRAIDEECPGVHVRMRIEIFRHDGQHMDLPEHGGRRDRQGAGRRLVMAGRGGFCFGDVAQYAATIIEVAASRFGGLDRPGSADEQARADQLL